MTDFTLEDKEKRGLRARELLQSSTFQEVMGELSHLLHSAIDSIPTDDDKAVMSIVRQLRAVRSISNKLQAWSSEAKTIQIQRDGNESD